MSDTENLQSASTDHDTDREHGSSRPDQAPAGAIGRVSATQPPGGRQWLRRPSLTALAGFAAAGALAGVVGLSTAGPSIADQQAMPNGARDPGAATPPAHGARDPGAATPPTPEARSTPQVPPSRPHRADRSTRRAPVPAKPKPSYRIVRRYLPIGPGQRGEASYYGDGDGSDGGATASGEAFDSSAMTAAHRSLPFGTIVRVCWVGHGTCVLVRVNDRGPYYGGRIIDLSAGAADRLGLSGVGVGEVTVTPVELRSVRVPVSR